MNGDKKIKVGVIGATGYAGAELVRILLTHPNAEIAALSSVSFEGKSIEDVYPALNIKNGGYVLTDETSVIAAADVVFAALPHGLSEVLAEKCLNAGKKLIDLGADFRLTSEEEYEAWYGKKFAHLSLHEKSAYVIPELNRKNAAGKEIIANPGCYPTSVALALAPAIKAGLIKTDGIVIDSKSGVTGAGRSLTLNTHFTETNEAFGAYKIASHRHTPEIEETLSNLAGKSVKVLFVPHLLPVNRGIESTIYADISPNFVGAVTDRPLSVAVLDLYQDFYKDEQFVRVMPAGVCANIKTVKCSNYCDISVHIDLRTNKLIVSSVIDNMVKGAAGQAVQNMNLMCGLPEETGLKFVPPAF